MSFLKHRRGSLADAAVHLLEGFKIAEQKKYHIIWNMDRNDFVKICTLAIELEVREAVGYATHLLSTSLADRAGRAIEQLETFKTKDTKKSQSDQTGYSSCRLASDPDQNAGRLSRDAR